MRRKNELMLVSLSISIYYTLLISYKHTVASGLKHGNPISTGKLPLMVEPNSAHLHIEYENHPWSKTLSEKSGYTELKDDITERELNEDSDEKIFQPLRITFDETNLVKKFEEDALNEKLALLKTDILPAIRDYYQQALAVEPNTGIIDLNMLQINKHSKHIYRCFAKYDSGERIRTPAEPRYNNTDIVVFVTVSDAVLGYDLCNDNMTLASSATCILDQFDRPVVGVINFCLSALHLYETSPDYSEYYSTTDAIEVGIHQLGHVLGMNSDMFKYFRAPNGLPMTKRPFYNTTIKCASGDIRRNIVLPGCDVLKEIVVGYEPVEPFSKIVAFEIVTPTVQTVLRNQFNCPTVTGARLESYAGNKFDCFGSHWFERYYYSELFSTYFTPQSDISPLTLAFFEDTGWYRANYSHSKTSVFGLHAGCSFLDNECIVDGEVPSWSKGYFCNDIMTFAKKDDFVKKNDTEVEAEDIMFHLTCDPTATFKTACDLTHLDKSVLTNNNHRSYFEDKLLGPLVFTSADYCPMPVDMPMSCQNDVNTIERFFEGEVFDSSSRCFEIGPFNTTVDNITSAACFMTQCDEKTRSFVVTVAGTEKDCVHDFQQLQFELKTVYSSTVKKWNVTCPRLSTVCPHGRGNCIADGNNILKCNCTTAPDNEEENENEDCSNSILKPQNLTERSVCSSASSLRCLWPIIFILLSSVGFLYY